MYAITAATGQLGRLALESLLKKIPAREIVAIVRDVAKASELGVEVRQADYEDPAALEAALVGVERLLLISSSSFERNVQHHSNVIGAAEKAGVKLLVYTSVIHCSQWPIMFADGHKATEVRLASSSVPYALLHNGWYWENHTQGLQGALAGGALVGAAGDAKISWAARKDFAEGAIAVLTGQNQAGKVYELAGDNGHTLAELAAELSRQTGKAIPYSDMTEAEYAAFLHNVAHLPEPFARVLAETEAKGLGAGLADDRSRTLSGLIGRPTTSLSEAVSQALAR